MGTFAALFLHFVTESPEFFPSHGTPESSGRRVQGATALRPLAATLTLPMDVLILFRGRGARDGSGR